MKELKALYIKELKYEKHAILGYVLLIAGLAAVLSILGRNLAPPGTSVLLMTQLLFLIPYWILWAGYDFLSREYKEDSVALWSALPVKSWIKLLAKALALWTESLLLSGLVVAGVLLVLQVEIHFRLDPGDIYFAGISSLMLIIAVLLIAFLPLGGAGFGLFISGSSLGKLSFPSRIATGLTMLGVVLGVERLLGRWLEHAVYFPDPLISNIAGREGEASFTIFMVQGLSLSTIAGVYAAGILGFLLGMYLLERRPLA